MTSKTFQELILKKFEIKKKNKVEKVREKVQKKNLKVR